MKSIGIKLADGSFHPILEDGATEKKELSLTTVNDDQTIVKVDLYRSESDSMEDAEYIDTLELSNLKKHPNGEPTISFNIWEDSEGQLSAELIDKESGSESRTSISLAALSGIQKSDSQTGEGVTLAKNSASNSSSEDTANENALPVDDVNFDLSETPDQNDFSSNEMPDIGNMNLDIPEESDPAENKGDVVPDLDDFDFDNIPDEAENNANAKAAPQDAAANDATISQNESDDAANENDGETQAGDFSENSSIQTDPTETQKIAEPPAQDAFDTSALDEPPADAFSEEAAFENPDAAEDQNVISMNEDFSEDFEMDEPSQNAVSQEGGEESAENSFGDDAEKNEGGLSIDTSNFDDATFAQSSPFANAFGNDDAQENSFSENENADFESGTQDATLPDLDLPDFGESDFSENANASENAGDDFSYGQFDAGDAKTAGDFSESDFSENSSSENSSENSFGTDFDLPDFSDTSFLDEPSKSQASSNFSDSDFDMPDFSDSNFDSDFSKSDSPSSKNSGDDFSGGSGALDFSGLYDKETEQGNSADHSSGGQKISTLICLACAVICVLAVLAVFFVIPTRFNLLKQKEEAQAAPIAESAKVVEAAPKSEELAPPAKEDEIVVITQADAAVPNFPAEENKPPRSISYKVKWGDTLWDLADSFYKNPWLYPKIANFNNIKNPNFIVAGTTILIPEE